MITAYFLIAAFLLGWLLCAMHHGYIKNSPWELIGTIALCIGWPYLAFVLFKMWREGRL